MILVANLVAMASPRIEESLDVILDMILSAMAQVTRDTYPGKTDCSPYTNYYMTIPIFFPNEFPQNYSFKLE
eukprot:6265951-Amphidinium_carterae.1